MQQVITFWRRSLLNKLIIVVVPFCFCCIPLRAATNRASISPTSIPTQAANIEPTAAVIDSTETAIPEPTTPRPTPRPTSSPVPEGYISRTQLGDKWPLSVEDGILACDTSGRVTFTSGGVVYAVNGTASGVADRYGWRQIGDLSVPDPQIDGLIINLTPLINRGLELC